MAALICESFGKVLSGCCSCLIYPCQKCGECFGKSCLSCTKFFGRVVCSPFFPYLAVTFCLNLPPVILGFQALGLQCDETSWLWINGALCLIHLLAAIYIINKIQRREHEEEQSHENAVDAEAQPQVATEVPTTSSATNPAYSNKISYKGVGRVILNNYKGKGSVILKMVATALDIKNSRAVDDPSVSDHGSFQRMFRVLCYDAGVAIYIFVALGWMIWLMVGLIQIFTDSDDNNHGENERCDSSQTWIITSLICGWLYCMLACVTFTCSFYCLR